MLDFIYHMTLNYFEIAFLVWKRKELVMLFAMLLWTPLHNITKSVNH